MFEQRQPFFYDVRLQSEWPMPRDQIIENQSSFLVVKCYPAQRQKQRMACPVYTSAGFTLIELLMVVAIIAIITMIGFPAFRAFVKTANISRTLTELRILETEIYDYQVVHGGLPPNLTAIDRGTLNDPWGSLYRYSLTPVRVDRFDNELNDDFDLWSMGRDGATEDNIFTGGGTGKDDVVRGREGSFLGLGADW